MTTAADIRAWMRDTMTATGLTIREWASRSGVAPSTISRALNADYEFVTSGRTLEKLARGAGVKAMPFSAIEAPPPALGLLPIRSTVQAGAWLETDLSDQSEAEHYPAAPDPRFPLQTQWLSRVQGESMNALERNGRPAGLYPGDLVHCVDVEAIDYRPRTGDIVEVERIRAQGGVRELTLKEVEVTPRGLLLWPRSTLAKWSSPIELAPVSANDHSDPDIEVRIRGWVIGVIRRF
ncbi:MULTISPECIES: LexA family protein [unclassified Brevundimonas]|uniref:LexA family protein n=1 Tax=unclassified Brevundimonas TaxID=2622653 RepID=UPI0025BDC341|nr:MULTISPECIES: hypothetical protein [unclassified Brevundimonas]